MGNSYPDRTNFNGVWKINELSKNKITHNNFPRGSTRATWGGGNDDGASSNVIDYVTMETTGNASDFGDLTVAGEAPNGSGSSTRGFYSGRQASQVNIIDYINFMSTGNASDFGDLTVATQYNIGASQGGGHLQDYIAHEFVPEGLFETQYSSGDTGLYGPGDSGNFFVDYFSISTLGDATDFGDCAFQKRIGGANSSTSRAFFVGGYDVDDSQATMKLVLEVQQEL